MKNQLFTTLFAILAALAFTLGVGAGCDNAKTDYYLSTYPQAEPKDSAARYLGQLRTVEGAPRVLADGTEIYSFRKDIPAEPLPPDANPGDESIPKIGRGPACLDGSAYNVLAQRGSGDGSNNIVIQAQGLDGACFPDAPTADKCKFRRDEITAAASWPTDYQRLPFLPDSEAQNPFAYNWNRVFLPNCDYFVHVSDINVGKQAGANFERYYRGTQNFTAGVQVAKRLAPNPDKVLVTGVLGGGYAAAINLPIVKAAFPDADIYVYSQSGPLMGNRWIETLEEPGPYPPALNILVQNLNAQYYIPDNCDECLADGSMWKAVAYYIKNDANNPNTDRTIRMGVAGSKTNPGIAVQFLYFPKNQEALATYTETFLVAFQGFLQKAPVGSGAGFLFNRPFSVMLEQVKYLAEDEDPSNDVASIYDLSIEGITLHQWLTQMLNNSPEWQPVSEPLPTATP